MALKDYMESQVAVAVAATAMVCSPRMREMLRRGAVYGVAGALMAGDAVASFARGVGRGAQQVAAPAPATPAAMEATVDDTDASVTHNGSDNTSGHVDAKVASKARSPRKKAHTDDDAQVTEATPDK